MFSVEPPTDPPSSGKHHGPEPKPWVRRLAQAQGLKLSEKQLGWWTFHLQEFLRYCRRRGERAEARILARGFFDELRQSDPPVASFRIDQTKQALTAFIRALQVWHWEQSPAGAWSPRFRLKAAAESAEASAAPAVPADQPIAVVPTNWEQVLRAELRVRHYALRTEEAYFHWARQFLSFFPAVNRADLNAVHVRRFLEHLAVTRNVAASTQNQALSALLFFFQHVLGRELGDLGETVRARRGRKLPTVLSRAEVAALLQATTGTPGLMVRLLYGCGLRLMECVRLRVKDVDLERSVLTVRSGKGDKDRAVPLPRILAAELAQHRARLQSLHAVDRRERLTGVWLPGSLATKYPHAGEEFAWQWFFPGKQPSLDPRSGLRRRHHVHDNTVHLVVKAAVRQAGIDKQVSCHTLRHSYATHLVEDGMDLRSIQELLGHGSVETTEVYTHVATPLARRMHSPLDTLGAGPLDTLGAPGGGDGGSVGR
jgi:integron integrase